MKPEQQNALNKNHRALSRNYMDMLVYRIFRAVERPQSVVADSLWNFFGNTRPWGDFAYYSEMCRAGFGFLALRTLQARARHVLTLSEKLSCDLNRERYRAEAPDYMLMPMLSPCSDVHWQYARSPSVLRTRMSPKRLTIWQSRAKAEVNFKRPNRSLIGR